MPDENNPLDRTLNMPIIPQKQSTTPKNPLYSFKAFKNLDASGLFSMIKEDAAMAPPKIAIIACNMLLN